MELAIFVFLVMIFSAILQRVSGMGFALIALPSLIWVLGPLDSVTLVVLTGIATSVLMIFSVWKEIFWSHALYMAIPSVLVIFPTVFLLQRINGDLISTFVGVLLVAATILLVVDTKIQGENYLIIEIGVGAVSGLLNATAGASGPLISAYAFASSWSYRMFVATAQPYFIIVDMGVLLAKWVFYDTGTETSLDAPLMLISVAGCFIGLILAKYISRFISGVIGRRIVVFVSACGAVSTLTKGILSIL